jgi:hypothetical protein
MDQLGSILVHRASGERFELLLELQRPTLPEGSGLEVAIGPLPLFHPQ